MAGPLKNRRWERFCHAFVGGTPFAVAYEQAGFKTGPWSYPNARKLARHPRVRQRIDELMAEAADRAVVGVNWIQLQLVDIIEGKAESKGGVRDGKVFTETDRLAALTSLARTLGIGDTSVNVNASAAVGIVAGEVTDAALAERLAAFIDRHKPQELEFSSSELDMAERDFTYGR